MKSDAPRAGTTDPFPIHLEPSAKGGDGGVRLYHTHTVMDGRIMASDSPDGLAFALREDFTGLDPGDHDLPDRWLDPVVLHLPDGRIVAYFTRIVFDGTQVTSAAIGRAWAVD